MSRKDQDYDEPTWKPYRRKKDSEYTGCLGRWGRARTSECAMMPVWRFLGRNFLGVCLVILLIGDLFLANKIRSIYADVDITPHALARKVSYP